MNKLVLAKKSMHKQKPKQTGPSSHECAYDWTQLDSQESTHQLWHIQLMTTLCCYWWHRYL